MLLKLQDFDYNLPLELIAQKAIKPRDHSRLLLLDRKTGRTKHEHFYDIKKYLQPGDLLVLNDSRVFKARLKGVKKESGGAVEVFLHKKISSSVWECLLKGRVKVGLEIKLGKNLKAVVLTDNNDGTWQVEFNLKGDRFWQEIDKIGEVPLPPYIKRTEKDPEDKNRYQTVFASLNKIGSAAAPTAGLHFTKKLLQDIKKRGVKIVTITLHVGLGTFAPFKTEIITEHRMHSEFLEIKTTTIKSILKTKAEGGRIIPVGTTSCRALESLDWERIKSSDNLKKQSFWTDIFIYPGYCFKVTDALITNFHLPKSSLLMLVSALASRKIIKKAYQEAILEKYHFFSYGDAMFIF